MNSSYCTSWIDIIYVIEHIALVVHFRCIYIYSPVFIVVLVLELIRDPMIILFIEYLWLVSVHLLRVMLGYLLLQFDFLFPQQTKFGYIFLSRCQYDEICAIEIGANFEQID